MDTQREDPNEIGQRAQRYWVTDFAPASEAERRTGWLYNLFVTETVDDATKQTYQAVALLFIGEDGETFRADRRFAPYFYVMPRDDAVEEVELGLKSTFSGLLADVQRVEKEDLDMPGHLSGKLRLLLKLVFHNVADLKKVRDKVAPAVKRNQRSEKEVTFAIKGGESMSADGAFYKRSSTAFLEKIRDMREYDVFYHVRMAIDEDVFVGKWYVVRGDAKGAAGVVLEKIAEDRINPQPRILAFDIETTKAPLKFPQPDTDQVYMISWMLDGQGFLIINREVVTADIEDFEYSPNDSYKGKFKVWNEADECALIRRFFAAVREQRPHVYVTYNGDFFDFPFVETRAQKYGIDMNAEIGFRDKGGTGETLSAYCPHLDCLYWVNRDSYLPQGSRGLKAVAKHKLGYEPLEIHHEDMLPMAKEDPRRMAAYSVSDAVATYYLYMKYVNPFIFSLCTIIPMRPDEVLRKGSGTVCEHLLMDMAFRNNVLFPNKQVTEREKFHNGKLLDQETYVGGHVEALKSGVFRSDIPLKFDADATKFQELIDGVDAALEFAVTVENGMKVEDITNLEEIRQDIKSRLQGLKERPSRSENPHILHLDVSAMYPNIILTNRLQPPAMVSAEDCAACPYNQPESNCKRRMKWLWKGECFVLGRGEFNMLKQQLQKERFAEDKVQEAQTKMAAKRDWKFQKRKPLVDRNKPQDRGGKKRRELYHGGGTGYRRMQGKEAKDLVQRLQQEELEDENSEPKDSKLAFTNLAGDQQHAMLKKRVTDYCRKAHAKLHKTSLETREATVCQRENGFFINTVLQFRDRRYKYKGELKRWKGRLEDALAGQPGPSVAECRSRCVLYESLQLAHKCILNSFYGYVMRRGSRWHSMEMAAAVTYCGATLITMARELVDRIGVSLELDTDGIWCCLPGSFPMEYALKTTKGKTVKVSYPCVVLNKDTWGKYTNHQYQTQVGPTEFKTHSECSILFEVDGPYKSMVLPASKEEGQGIKKRYAVFELDGKLAELKGFELKRRGELQIIKDFQAAIFGKASPWLTGSNVQEVYDAVAQVANQCLDVLVSRGEQLEDAELMDKIQESCNMSRRLEDYAKDQKGMALTCAKRIANFLGAEMVKDKGLSCVYVISRKPEGRPVTERPIPIQIFSTEPAQQAFWLRKWCEDPSIGVEGDVDIRDIVDWEYYIKRLGGSIQKIVTIPAAYQGVANPVPRITHPDWLARRVREANSKAKQTKLGFTVTKAPAVDIEDMGKVMVRGQTPASQRTELEQPPQARKRARSPQQPPALPPAPSAEFRLKFCSPVWAGEGKDSASAACIGWSAGVLADPEFSKWITHASAVWRRGRQDPPAAKARPGLQNMLRSAHDQLLRSEWDIVEIRQHPADPPHVVRALVMVGEGVRMVRVTVPRTVQVNSHCEWDAGTVSRLGAEKVSLVLPRRRTKHHLYRVPLRVSSKDDENEMVQQLRTADCEGVYEAGVGSIFRAVMRLGSRCRVNVGRHRARGGQAEVFHVDDLEPLRCSAVGSAAAEDFDVAATDTKYLAKPPTPVFLYRCGHGARGVVCLVLPHRNEAHVAFWRPHVPGAEDEAVRWGDLWAEASARSVADTQPEAADVALAELGPSPDSLTVRTSWSADEHAAWRGIDTTLRHSASVARRVVILSQTQLPSALLLQRLTAAADLPTVGIPFNADDAAALQSSLQWGKDLGRRALYRFLCARPFVAEVARMARFARVPLANIAVDTHLDVLDVVYARMLERHSHALWNGCLADVEESPAMAAAAAAEASKSPTVVVPGSYQTWVVEIAVPDMEVLSVIFSQALTEQDGDARGAFDQQVLSHFQLLWDITTRLYHGMLHDGREEGNALLADLTRWLKSPSSALHDPHLAAYVARLAKKLFGALLTRLTKLGCKVVFADLEKIIVATSKSQFPDAVRFTDYLLTALREQNIADAKPFEHMHLTVVQWWSEYIFLGPRDFAGVAVPGIDTAADGTLLLAGVDLAAHEASGRVQDTWDLAGRFCGPTRSRFSTFIMEFLAKMHKERTRAVEDVKVAGNKGTVASQEERVRQMCLSSMRKVLEDDFTQRLLKEVHNIRGEQAEQRLGDRRTGGAADAAAPDVAVDYVNSICHVLGQEDALADSVRHLRHTVLQICGVGAHSKAAAWRPRPTGVVLPAVMCTFCHASASVDLLPGGEEGVVPLTADPKAAAALWHCPTCDLRYDRDRVESRLVDRANACVASVLVGEPICLRCGLPQRYGMQRRCECGGEWGTDGTKPEEARAQLTRMRRAAQVHGLHWLLSVTGTLLGQ